MLKKLLIGSILLSLVGCSSAEKIPDGVKPDVYSSWKNYSTHCFKEDFYSYTVVYSQIINKDLFKTYRDFYLTFNNENKLLNYYKNLITPSQVILDKKGDFDTIDDVIKKNQDELEKAYIGLSKVIKYNYKNTTSFDRDKYWFDYIQNITTGLLYRNIFSSVSENMPDVSDVLLRNIHYNLQKQQYEIYIRFKQEDISYTTVTETMQNAFGHKALVETKTFTGTGLSVIPSQAKIVIPFKKDLAQKYPLDDLNVDLYFVLTSVVENSEIEKPKLNKNSVSNDFRTIYSVSILGLDLKYKNQVIYSSNL